MTAHGILQLVARGSLGQIDQTIQGINLENIFMRSRRGTRTTVIIAAKIIQPLFTRYLIGMNVLNNRNVPNQSMQPGTSWSIRVFENECKTFCFKGNCSDVKWRIYIRSIASILAWYISFVPECSTCNAQHFESGWG
jgi:hypothetical protein